MCTPFTSRARWEHFIMRDRFCAGKCSGSDAGHELSAHYGHSTHQTRTGCRPSELLRERAQEALRRAAGLALAGCFVSLAAFLAGAARLAGVRFAAGARLVL